MNANSEQSEQQMDPLPMGSGSLEEAARFAATVLECQVLKQGREWSPKLAYEAAKYLRTNLPEARS